MKIVVTRNGQTDIELNDVERQQARETKIWLDNYFSIKKSKKTAKIINESLKVTIIEDSKLMEKNLVCLKELQKNEIKLLKETNT